MTTEQLNTIGTAMYGARWMAELARQLDVATRTVQGWASGTRPIPDRRAIQIVDLAQTHGRHLLATVAEMQKW